MIELGKYQTLTIVKKTDFGVYLAEDRENKSGEAERVLLPIKQVLENAKPGDAVKVFIYRDSKDRLIATTAHPKLMVGELAVLKVNDVTKIGAFLDWDLKKTCSCHLRSRPAESWSEKNIWWHCILINHPDLRQPWMYTNT